MIVKPRSRLRNKISHLLLKARKRIENEIRSGFVSTGESHVIEQFAKDHAGSRVVVFDIGANTGAWSSLMETAVKKYGGTLELHAFEPIAQYRGPGTLVQMAVSDVTGMVPIHIFKSHDQTSLYERRPTYPKQGVAKQATIPAIRLDEYIQQHHIDHIHFIKVDVEGHEHAAVRSLGAYLRPDFVDMIQFEYGLTYVDARAYLYDMYELLKEYRICKIFRNRIELTPYHGDREDFMYTNYLALK